MHQVIRDRLREFPPLPLQPTEAADGAGRVAAVLIPITLGHSPEIVFIRRAEHLNSHRGQVAFPGGMWEPGDDSLLATALRESEEEIALPPDQVEVIAAFEPRTTRFDVQVCPYVGLIPPGLPLVPDLSELESVFTVPVDFLLEPGSYGTTVRRLVDQDYEVPCIHFGDYCIWGFTLHLLMELLGHVYDLEVPMQYYPIETMD